MKLEQFSYKIIIACSILLLFSARLHATDYYWKTTGRADQLYTNAANWESAPGSGIPANGSLAPSSTDNVYFPAGNGTQTITISSGAAAANFNVLATGIITFSGTISIYGNFTSNGKHQFVSLIITFLGAGNHTINMGDNAAHSTSANLNFNGAGSYTLLSDLNLPGAEINIVNNTFIANGNWIKVGRFIISQTIAGTKTVNLANSKLSVNRGASNSGALVFGASPATTSYDWTNAEIYIDQNTASTFINTGSSTTNGTVITGIKSITFTESALGISAEHIRSSNGPFDLVTADFNINVSSFNLTGGGRLNLTTTNLNLLRPVDMTSNGTTRLSVNAINETASCLGQSSLRTEGATPISFNATALIATTNISFKSIAFSGSTVTMPANNDLGLNTGTYSTIATAPSRSFYWVGGTGNWNDPAKWSILGSGGAPQSAAGCLPNNNDDVYFDAGSFTAVGQTVTITGSNSNVGYARNVYWTDPNKRGKLVSGVLNINGSADFSGSTTVASALIYVGGGTHTLTSGNTNYTTTVIQFFGTGTYTLADNLIASSALLQFGSGTFNSNGKTIVAQRFLSSSIPAVASNLRHLDFSNSVLTFNYGNGGGLNAFVLSTPFLGSFNATASTINLSAPNAAFYVNGYLNNGTVTLNNLGLNDVNFTANTGTSIFDNSGVLNFSVNNLSFASNATINQGGSLTSHTVNTYNFSPGKSYVFLAARTYTITNAINSNSTGSCSPKINISGSLATRARLYKAGLPFTIDNATIQNIQASGAALSVPGGEDLGNNLNVNIMPNPPQVFYWVGGTGNWNDATHWSIGVSGGNPSITNVNNCIPSITDDVFFDTGSFTANNQTVTIDNTANCRNMTWTADVSSRTPIFTGIAGLALNTYGTVTLAPGMTFSFVGNWNMKGTGLALNANAISTNGVAVRSLLTLDGGGRYDFLDDFNSNSNIRFTSGQFYTNSKSITAASLNLQVTGTNKADISNSFITLNSTDNTNTYIANHSSTANWNATGSTININARGFSMQTPSGVTIDYGTLNVNQTTTATISSGSGTLRFTNLNFLRPNSLIGGRFIIDNLTYAISSNNGISSGSIITVNNKLTANGTPCNPIIFYSSTAGSPATLISALCNFDIKFGRLTDITAGGSCTIAQNKVIGDDAGGNSNWTFRTIATGEYLGPDVVLNCKQFPYGLSTAGFNQGATSYLWNTGATTPDITVTGPGTYRVTVTYGTGCTLSDEIVIGVVPSPVLNATTVYACASTSGGNVGSFMLTDANALLVATPADYTFTYHASSADAIAGLNALPNTYTGLAKTIYVRVEATATGCFSTREVNLVVKTWAQPVVSASQKICATIYTSLADVAITGTNVKWYSDAVSTAVLPLTTLLVNGATYYATQTSADGCESTRVPVTVILSNCGVVNQPVRVKVAKN